MMKTDEERPEQPLPPDVEISVNDDDGIPESPSSLRQQILGGDEKASLAYAGITVSSIVLLIALTGDFKGHHYYKYGISVGSIAMILSVLGWFMAVKVQGVPHLVMYNNYVLFLWCFIGACILTFEGGPFQVTGNGYFGSWGLAVFSTMLLGVNHSAQFQATREQIRGSSNGPLFGVFVSSIILLISISSYGIHKYDRNYGILVYSLVLGLLSILICLGFFMETGGTTDSAIIRCYVMGVFTILWVTAACLLTFHGPFINTGNGYFAAWGGAVTSVIAVNVARRSQQQT